MLGHVSNTNFMKYSAVLKFSSWSSGSTKEVSAGSGKKKTLLKRRNWPWRGFDSSPLTLKKIGSLKETLTISQAVLFVNARRKQSGWVGVWRERVYDLCSAGVLQHQSEWCQDQLGSNVYSVRALILLVLTSCFILKCGVILGFLSTFPHVIGLPSLMCSTCVSLSP